MRKQILLYGMLFSLLAAIQLSYGSDDKPFVRYPALNPDGSQLAFSFQGDIWKVPIGGGNAVRLTIHQAYESMPKWCPDGKNIAFSSDRYGNDDIFVMPSSGGTPKRLTYHSAPDIMGNWVPGGKILFETRRVYDQIEWDHEIYEVSERGGTPVRKLDALGYMPAESPDGRFIAFVKGACRIEREAYRGPANKEIWLFDTKSGKYTKLTDFDGNDIYPDWGDARTIYYISSQSGKYNIFRMKIDDNGAKTGSTDQITSFTDDGVRYFDVSGDGNTLAMEKGTDIYTMKTSGGEPARVNINVSDDYRFDPVVYKNYSDQADEFDVSPNGKYTAFVVRGEIFVKENDKEKSRTVNLTENPYRDENPVWLSDTTLVFISDREGQFDLYLLRSSDKKESNLFKSLKHEAVRLTDTKEEEANPVISPDGKKISYLKGRGVLITADINADGKLTNEKELLNGWATPTGMAWSPDSKWLAYSLPDLDFNDEIYIQAADNSGKPVNVSMHPRSDNSPAWSPDGSKLGFISNRNNGDDDLWFVWLTKSDWEKTKQDWDESGDETPEKPAKKDKDSTKVKPVKIDFDKIYERLSQVTALPGNESDIRISNDGKTFYFVTNRNSNQTYNADMDLYSINWDGTKMKALTSGGKKPYGVVLDKAGKNLFFMQPKGKLYQYDLKTNKEEGLPFSASLKIDYTKERKQIFEEAWRTLRDGFYDPNFHGQNWAELKKEYEDKTLKASTERDFRAMFNFMLGQLNASHMGLYGSDRSETQDEKTGQLGVEVEPKDDGVLIKRVVLNSPADKETSKLKAGETIISVDGEPVTLKDNFYSFLINKNDKRVILEVKDEKSSTREVVIRPAASLRTELYDEWVEQHRKLTDKYSNGRLGYIHIQGMNWPSFERFERELTASGLGKEGLVIDVRFNGGGWTTDYLMTVLTYKQHAYTIPRGAASNLDKQQKNFVNYYPFGERLPFAAWTKPSVAMCNSYSYSNAEIFSHAYKTLNIGKLVGEPTFGAVISTGGKRLLDGSFVRLPSRGWYVKATEKGMENGPAVPDLIVYNKPNWKANGDDAQLKAAVDELLKQIGK